jgi:hypothetical protein
MATDHGTAPRVTALPQVLLNEGTSRLKWDPRLDQDIRLQQVNNIAESRFVVQHVPVDKFFQRKPTPLI